MRLVLGLLFISLLSVHAWARPDFAQSRKVKLVRLECVFEEPFFKTTFIAPANRLSAGNVVVQDLTMATKDILKNMKLVRTSQSQLQIQFANGTVFQNLRFVGKGSQGRSTKSLFFKGKWSAYNYGPAPIGECHTL